MKKKQLTDFVTAFRQTIKRLLAEHAQPAPRPTTRLTCEPLEDRSVPAASFFSPAESSGSVNVQLVPLANVAPGVQEIVTFGVPFTRGSVSQSQLSQIRVLKNGVEIPAFVEQLTPWRSIDDAAIDGQSVRVARIQIPYTFTALTAEAVTVQWGGPARALNVTTMQDPRIEWHAVTGGTFVAADNVEEPDVLPVLPGAYLSKGMLDARTDPTPGGVAPTRDNPATMDTMTFSGYQEYDYAEKNFFYTIINQNGGTPIDYKTQAEPWLYDRSSGMYELYFRSGFATALREAIRSTDFYADHLDSNGFFTLKPGDPKYAYNEALAYTYWLLGDNRMLAPISTVVNAFNGTATHWTPQLSFWTERNTGDKLLAAEMAYEVTGNATFKASVQTIVGDLIYHQNGANGQLPANRVDGGLYHYGFQHDLSEVSSANVLIASSWMSALIVDPMVRVFGVWQNNAQIPDFIVRLGNFEKVASKFDSGGQFGGITRYPDYLMRPDGTSDNRSGTDVQHAMDVGAVAAWATYFAELRGTPDASLRQLANDLYATYDVGVNSWTSSGSGYVVTPPRRYTWEYKNSPNFSWALTGTDAPSAGLLSFSAPIFSVVENQLTATITVKRARGSTGTVSVNYATSNGTATAGSDYTATSGTLIFADGETTKTFTIPIINDSAVENMETIILTLSNPTGGAALDSPATAKLTIDSDDTTSTPVTSTFQQGVNGYTGTVDADFSNQNGGNGAKNITGNSIGVWQASNYTIEGLIRFDNLGITTHATTDATVTSATLTLTVDFGTTASTIRGYYLLKPWSTAPGTDLGWLHSGAGVDWAVPGGTGQGTDVIAGKSFTLTGTGTQTITITLDAAVVQSWIDNPNTNQGILLVNETPPGPIARVSASENATAAARPKLTVNYTVTASAFPGSLQFSNPTYSVNENGGTATITVTRTGGSSGSVSVNYATSNGTATAGSDYAATSGTLIFADGETTKTFTIPITNDNLVEFDESINLTLSNPTGGASLGSQSTALLSIVSDDVPQPGVLQFSTASYSVNENGGMATITVTRTGGSNVAVSVNYATSNGGAVAGSDYAATSGTLIFAVGETSKTFTIPITNDTLVEGNETVNLTLSGPTNGATLGSQTTATLTIISDDTTGTIAATFQQGVNGYTGMTDVAITSQSGVNTNFTGNIVRVFTGSYSTEDLFRFSNLGIAAGSTVVSASLTLNVSSFTANQLIRGYYVLAPWNGTPGTPATQVGFIHRGNGTDWSTPGALGQGTDVIAGKSFLLPGITANGGQTITVTLDPAVVQSWIDNPNANQGIILVNETTGASFDVSTADSATITARPLLSINYNTASPGTLQFSNPAYSVNESGTTATVTVTRTGGSSGSVSVNYATSNGTTTASSDYTATSGTLIFADGETTKTFTVPITNDTAVEGNETINLTLNSLIGGSILGAQTTATLTIQDDDVPQPGALQFSTASYSVNENAGTATITVTRTGGSNVAVSVDYATSNGTATASSDYTATSGTLNFDVGETSKTFTIPITNDSAVEGDETVTLTLSNPTGGATLGAQTTATLTIISDDVAQPGVVQLSNATYTVNESQGTATITVTRTGGSDVAVSVSYATSNGTATAGSDYTATSGTLNFGIGEMSKTFTVPIINDTAVEGDETINLTLSSPTGGATLGTSSTATLTVASDDAQTVTTTYQQGVNGYTGMTDVAITSQSGVNTNFTGNYVRVYSGAYATENLFRFSNLDIAAGSTVSSVTLTLSVSSFTANQLIRGYYVLAPWNGTPGTPATQVGFIHRGNGTDWSTPGARGQGTDVIAGKSFLLPGITANGNQTITITLDAAVVQSWIDNPNANQGILLVNETPSTSFDVNTDDNPTIALRPKLSITYTTGAPQPGTLQFSSPTYSVNESGATATVTVTRTGGSAGSVSVNYATSNGTATAGSDYTATSGTLTFADGETSKTFTIPIANDTTVEGNETINLTLSSPAGGATLGTQSNATLTIQDDDVAPQPGTLRFSASSYSQNESGGTVTITVTRTGGSSGTVSINYATSNGTATAGSDYPATSGTLTFADGETSKTFTVSIINDTAVEGNETINLTLSSPTGGATLGSPSAATITIVDNDTAPPTGTFTNIDVSSGVEAIVNQKLQEDPNWWMTGQHFVDLDSDGDLDLFLDAHNGTSVVALNDGHGVFTRLTTGNWPSSEIHEMYDINGDGKIDLAVTFQDGGGQWWINNSTPGNVNFTPTNVTRGGNTSRAQVLIDFNGDGKVDWLRSEQPGLVIDFGNGAGGFTAGSLRFTIPGTTTNNNANFLPGDFDGDGDIDLLVLTGGGYDGTLGKTAYWRNNGDMTFTDITASVGLPANGTVAKGVGDFDQDGDIDIIAIENKAMPPVIYINDGTGVFTKKANAISGVASGTLEYAAWGTAVVTDFDNDGIADIIMDGKYYLKVLRGTGGGNFTYMNTAWGIKDTAASAVDDGLGFGDIDGDGDLDIIGYDQTFPTRTLNVYRNDLPSQNWLNVRPVGLAGNVGAAGAKIRIYAAGTNQLLWFEQVAQYDFQVATSYYGTSQTERHYGLGSRTAVDVVVEFPDGHVTRINNVAANQTIQVLQSAN